MSSLGLGQKIELSVSLSQHQSQHSSSQGGVARYLLKLWIQKRLQQIQSNQTVREGINLNINIQYFICIAKSLDLAGGSVIFFFPNI